GRTRAPVAPRPTACSRASRASRAAGRRRPRRATRRRSSSRALPPTSAPGRRRRSSPRPRSTSAEPSRSPPAQAERVAGRVGVDPEAARVVRGVLRLQLACPEAHDMLVRARDVLDVQVEVDLLWLALRPLGPDVVRRKLEAEPGLAVDEDRVPVLVGLDRPVQDACPEGALGLEVVSVEHDDLLCDLHLPIVTAACDTRLASSMSEADPRSRLAPGAAR